MRILSGLAAVTVSALLLAGCSTNFKTGYETGVDPSVSRNWRVTAVDVKVPEELTVSDRNTWVPQADIVWHGDVQGDRKVQIAKVLEEGIERGTAKLRGNQPVTIGLTVQQFHAITPIVEQRLSESGVHDIQYTIQVFDSRTGQPITQPEFIEADAAALVGEQAREARLAGLSQREEVIRHIARVTEGWVGTGPDQRKEFKRLGR